MEHIITKALRMVSAGNRDLGYSMARDVFEVVLGANLNLTVVGHLLIALHRRGETLNELLACVHVVQERQTRITDARTNAIDVGGSGGDGGKTFNISTAAAITSAAAGICVYKHGSSKVSSQCGSIDVVRALGIPVAENGSSADCQLRRNNIVFLDGNAFQNYPPHLRNLRIGLGSPTIFNLVGPWCNPARTKRQVIGVMNERHLPSFANIARSLNYEHLLLVHGRDEAIDEFSVAGSTIITEYKAGTVSTFVVRPETFGLRPSVSEALGGRKCIHECAYHYLCLGREGARA